MTEPTKPFRDEDVRRYLASRAEAVASGARGPDAVAAVIAERVGYTPRGLDRGRVLRLAVVLALLAALVAATLLVASRQEPRYAPLQPEVTSTLRFSPFAIAAAERSIWVGASAWPVLFELDPADGAVVAEHALRSAVCGQVVGAFGAIWVSECGASTIARLDPATGRIDRLAGYATQRVAIAPDGVWLTAVGAVERVDPASLATLQRIPVAGSGPLAWGFGSVWLADVDADVVRRIDPITGEISTLTLPSTAAAPAPRDLAVTTAAVWVVDEATRRVHRIDPATGTITQVAALLEPIERTPFEGHLIQADAGGLWVRSSEDSILELDPISGSVIGRQATEAAGGGAFAVTGDAIWYVNTERQAVVGLQRP